MSKFWLHLLLSWFAVLWMAAGVHGGENQGGKGGYNAPWPKGRGFKVGQTVPDIPLYDMQGREIRLSKFLGKRYVLYAWASW